jgi:iron complex transport system substrate-binding protein
MPSKLLSEAFYWLFLLVAGPALLAGPAEARIVEDVLGRRVNVPDRVERVVALGSSLSFLAYLGAYDLALAVERPDTVPLDKPYMLANLEKARTLPVVGLGGANRNDNYEAILSLGPQVILLLSTRDDEIALLERKLGIPVVGLRHGLADFEEGEFIRSIEVAGEIVGKDGRAAQLVSFIRGLHGELGYRPPEPARAYVGGLGFKGAQGITSTTTRSTPMAMAGIENLAAGLGPQGHVFVDREFLLTQDPGVVFIDSGGLPLVREAAREDPGYFRRLSALGNGRAFSVLPHTSYFNNPEILYANAFFMAKAVYPEKYAHLDPVAKADEIFTAFVGVPLYENYKARGLGYGKIFFKGGSLEVGDY